MMLTTHKTHILEKKEKEKEKKKHVLIPNTKLYFFTFKNMLLETWYHTQFFH